MRETYRYFSRGWGRSVREMWYLILAGTTIVFIWLWFVEKVANASLLWYLTEKNIPFPCDADMKKGAEYAVKHFFDDLRKRR